MIQKSDIPATALKYSHNESKISFSENKRTYTADNISKKKILGFHVDGGLIVSKQIRKCDYALVVEEDLCYLIELKGQGIEEACEQLSVTIEYFSENYKMQKFVGRIVVSRYNTHKVHSEKYIVLERKLRMIQKKFLLKQKPLWITENKMEDRI